MADAKLVAVSKGLVDAIQSARNDGTLCLSQFEVDWEIGGRVQLRHAGASSIPEDWILRDDKLQVRVMLPRKYEPAERKDQTSQSWVAAWDIDIRQRLGVSSQDDNQTIDRTRLNELILLTEQIFEATGPDLDEARVSITDYEAEWIGRRDGIAARSQTLVTCSPLHLGQRQFYSAIRQVFELTT